MESLEAEVFDEEGHTVKLIDTVASESVLDLPDEWYSLNTFLLGCPKRLIEIANLKLEGKPIPVKDRLYLSRMRRKLQNKLIEG